MDEEGAAVLVQSLVRRKACIEKLQELRKRDAHRNQVVQEILKTEQLYVSNLRVVVGVFLNPLRSSIAGPEPVCTHDELKLVFSNVEAIYALNNSLLQSISRRINNWGPAQCLGDVFLLMTPYLKMYTEYCNNYENALNAYNSCMESDSFRHFMSICTSFPEANNLTFVSFLIMPVQRIPRYNLLLKDLLKHTNEEHPDHKSLEEAVKKMQEVANYVNYQMKIAQSMKSITRIIEEIGADSDLYKAGRIFVREGRVKQATTKGIRKIFMYLFNDCLALAVKLGQGVMKKKQFCYWRTIELPGCWAVPANDGSSIKNIFHFVTCGESITFFADSAETRADWISAINETINDLYEKHPEKKKEKFPYIVDAKLEQKLKQMVDDDPDDDDEAGQEQQEQQEPHPKQSGSSSAKYRTLPRKFGAAQVDKRQSVIPAKPLPAVPSRARKPPLVGQNAAVAAVRDGSPVLERTISSPLQRMKIVVHTQSAVETVTPKAAPAMPGHSPPTPGSGQQEPQAQSEHSTGEAAVISPQPEVARRLVAATPVTGEVAVVEVHEVTPEPMAAAAVVSLRRVPPTLPYRDDPPPSSASAAVSPRTGWPPEPPYRDDPSPTSGSGSDSPGGAAARRPQRELPQVPQKELPQVPQKSLPQVPQRPLSPAGPAIAAAAVPAALDPSDPPPPYRVSALESMARQSAVMQPASSPASPRTAEKPKSTFVKRVFGNPRDSFKFSQPIVEVPSDMPVMMEGFLAKKGKINRAWKRRYFKLIGGHLFYFKSKNDSTSLGSIALMESGTVLGEPNPPAARDHAFQVTEGTRLFLLAADTAEEKQEWTQWILQHIPGV